MVMWTAKADKTLENEGKVLLENNTQEISLKTYSHRRPEVVFRLDETCFCRNATYPENVTNMRSGSFQNSSEMNPRRSYTGARNEFQNIVTQWRVSRPCPRVSKTGPGGPSGPFTPPGVKFVGPDPGDIIYIRNMKLRN